MANFAQQPHLVPVELFVTTQAMAATVTVESMSGIEEKIVTRNSIVVFQLPRSSAVLQNTGTTAMGRAVKITSDQRIIVYGTNKESFTTDAFLALPIQATGQLYYTVSWYPPTYNCEIGIAATSDMTSVEIRLPTKQQQEPPTRVDKWKKRKFLFENVTEIPPEAGDNYEPQPQGFPAPYIPCEVEFEGVKYGSGSIIRLQMNALSAFQLQAKCDLTGTLISATKPISVFSGNDRTAIGSGATTRDHLVEQIPPVTAWGRQFVTVPIPRRTVGDFWKIVAAEDDTEVTINGINVDFDRRSLTSGQQWLLDFGSESYAFINSTKPILVTQFVKSQQQGSEDADPAMVLATPLEQFGSSYTFTTIQGVATTFKTNFMMIIVEKGMERTMLLDGEAFFPAEGWNDVDIANVTAGYILLKPGTHTISSRSGQARFAAYIYGAGDRESYAYPTGMCQHVLVSLISIPSVRVQVCVCVCVSRLIAPVPCFWLYQVCQCVCITKKTRVWVWLGEEQMILFFITLLCFGICFSSKF